MTCDMPFKINYKCLYKSTADFVFTNQFVTFSIIGLKGAYTNLWYGRWYAVWIKKTKFYLIIYGKFIPSFINFYNYFFFL